ncbi:MAG TPA: family 1 glycosylhydrolase [Abditibacterium sp.]|jgi:dTDP-4-dehydrorhamnose reductase
MNPMNLASSLAPLSATAVETESPLEIEPLLPPLELWGGVECTYNRVGERFFNQLEWNGHQNRVADLDLFAELGMTAVRYPVIWEKLAPHSLENIDWSWPDERLHRLRDLNIAPIADLVHHGSGPRYAEIQTSDFAPGLANFAGQIARRYPWIENYTPVNEPLTTARFCGLYGHWFPHGQSNDLFVRILLNECRAIALSMATIREVNSDAKLVQTDDLGRIFSTPQLAYQADFENLRRWLSFDLLCGRIDPGHEMWNYLVESGASMHELDWFCAHPCPPDVIGINHYPTSDRYLDENLARYPESAHGANARERYADVEAVRVFPQPLGGFRARLTEAWERYGLPLAITEAHLGCTREEQVRWTNQAWCDARELREEGVPVRAVTAWSLLGAWNWNSLVTRDAGFYEPGVFDTRGGHARPTAIAHLLRDLVNEGESSHPVLAQPGWWQRPERVYYPPIETPLKPDFSLHGAGNAPKTAPAPVQNQAARPILIVGASGTLGSEFRRACEGRGLSFFALSRDDIDLFDPKSIENVLAQTDAWAVINATGYGPAQCDAEACFTVHSVGAAHLARACAEKGVSLVCFSSAAVFDGHSEAPYLETDLAQAPGVFGASKRVMEERVSREHPGALIARCGAFFGPHDDGNFVTTTLRALSRGETVEAASDAVVSLTYVPDLAHTTLDLLIDGASGVWHLCNAGALSWADLARAAASRYGLSTDKIRDVPHATEKSKPRCHALSSCHGQILPSLENALERYKWDARI